MVRNLRLQALVWSLFAIALSIVACSGGKSVNDTGNNNNQNTGDGVQPADFSELSAFVERIAPPTYQAPATAPTVIEDWTDGPSPLLGKVFSPQEPMSIYANLDLLDMTIDNIEQLLQVDENGDFSPDSATIANDSDAVQLVTLTIGTAIPTAYQEVLGMLRIDVEYLARTTFVDPAQDDSVEVHFGFTQSQTTQRVLVWSHNTYGASDVDESFLFFADANSADSTVEMRGLFYKDNGDQTTDRWVYHIESVQDSNFAYRMSWYSDDLGGQSGVAAILGGGHKDSEFALRYRQFTPANSGSPDQSFMFDQTFGANFTAGDTTIATSYNQYVTEQLIFKYQAFPSAMIASPWAETQ